MARRNPANPRYQKGAEVGKTRRSAASAKPKRGVGDTAPTGSSGSEKKSRSRFLVPVPDDPEYKRWRRVWLGLLVAALVFSALAWWQQASTIGNLTLALAYGCIFTAFYIDFTKLRRMRKAAIEADKARKEGKKSDAKTGNTTAGSKKIVSGKSDDAKPPSESDE